MKKKEAIDYSIEEMDAQQRRAELNKEKDELRIKKERAHPFLLTRMGAGLIDFVFSAIIAVGVFFFSYFVIFPKVGYQSSSQYVMNAYKESQLFVYGLNGYEELTSHYDESKSPEENYDVPVTHYYTTDARAIEANKLESYINAKVESGFYYIDENGDCVRKPSASSANVLPTLEAEYDKAVAFFDENPELIHANYVANMTMSVTILIVATLGSSIFYMIVPLIDKRNRTFGYMILKLIPVDSKTLAPADKWKNLFRSFIFVAITFIAPFTMYLWFRTLAYSFIPFFVNTIVLCLSRFNTGLHDLATSINVLNASYSNSFEILETVEKQGGNNY